MHAAALTTYNQVRDVAVSYLQAKRVWDRSAKGKDKGKDKPQRKGGKPNKGKDKDRCPICWRQGHEVQECWLNGKANGKGKPRDQKGKGFANVGGDADSTVSTAGPSASHIGMRMSAPVVSWLKS